MLAKMFAILGSAAAALGAGACFIAWIDEPEMPESLIK